MAGPSMLSGVVPGVIPGQQAPDYSPISKGVGQMMTALVNAEMMKKQQAGESLTKQIALVQAGFPIDPNAIRKTAKAAGFPIMKPDDMAAHVQSAAQGGGPSTSGTNASQKPPDPTQIKPNLPGVTPPTGGPRSPVSNVGQAKTQEQMRGDALDQWVAHAQKIAQMKGMTEQAKLENDLTLTQLKSDALKGNNEALGKLFRMGEIPFDIKREQWLAMNPDQQRQALNIAAGAESPAEFNQRRDRIAENLVSSGKFKDPQDAFAAADTLAKGQGIPASLQAKETPFTFKEMTEAAQFMNQLAELGVPPDQLAARAEAARTGGFSAAFPAGVKLTPLSVQEMELRQKQLGLEQEKIGIEGKRLGLEAGRMEIEVARYNAMAAKLDLEAKNEKVKADAEQFKALVDIKKAGGKVDDTIMQAAQEKVAQHLGVDVKQVNDFFHFLTGGTHPEFKPKPATDLVKGMVGQKPKNKTTEPSTLKKIFDVMSGKTQEPI